MMAVLRRIGASTIDAMEYAIGAFLAIVAVLAGFAAGGLVFGFAWGLLQRACH